MSAVYRHDGLVIRVDGPMLDLGRDRLDGMAGRNTYLVTLSHVGRGPVALTDLAEDGVSTFADWQWLDLASGRMCDPGAYGDRRLTLRLVLDDPDALIEAAAERADGGAA